MAATFAAAASGQELLIEDVTVLSSDRAAPLAGRHVLIRGDRIAELSERSLAVKPGVPRLDGRGKFLTPGLMDSHVHLSSTPGLPFATESAPAGSPMAELRAAYIRQLPRSYLYFGVTQVLDLTSPPEAIAELEDQPLRPDVFRCGAAPVLDGYPMLFLDKGVRYEIARDYLFEPANAKEYPLPAGENAEDHTPEAVVERIADRGARCVKVFIENGFGDATDWPLISDATLQRVRDAARKRGLLLLAHANALDMQRIAVANDVDVIVHGLWNWGEVNAATGVPEEIAAHLRSLRAKKIGFQPTMTVIAGLAVLFEPQTLDDPAYRKVVPPSLLAWYRTEDAQFFKRELRSGFDPSMPEERIAEISWSVDERGMRAAKYLHDLGHPLLLGSDTPSAPTYGNQPGYNTFQEIQLMARAGIPLQAIFAAGTTENARQFGLDADYGTVEPGKIANLLLLDANPLESAEAWGRIDKVILHGRIIERETLAADRD